VTRQRILVVEDDRVLLEGLRDMLEIAGYAPVIATGAREGLASIAEALPDLIVSDIMMPDMDGYAFFRAVRARPEWTAVPFIFLSARSEGADVRTGKSLGAEDYITKPFEQDDLLTAITSRLRRSSELDAVRRREFDALAQRLTITLNHELRSPLAEVSAYAQLLDAGGTDLAAEEFDDLMRGLQDGVARLARIVEDIVLLADLRSGRARTAFELRRARLDDVARIVREACAPFDGALRARDLVLDLDVPDDLPPVDGDAAYLRGAIARLVDNAVKFSRRAGGAIRVTAAADGPWIRISVTDKGIGIAEAAAATMFDAFRQHDRERLEQQGLGNGLTICHGLVALHRGEISVDSRQGAGATFTVRLPVAESVTEG
jgi:two-component system, sensor histidine kinase and response regulator